MVLIVAVVQLEKKNSINFSKKIVLTLVKQIQNVCLSLHYSGDES